MERRVLLAVVLSIGLIYLVNVLFPPVPAPIEDSVALDTAAAPAPDTAHPGGEAPAGPDAVPPLGADSQTARGTPGDSIRDEQGARIVPAEPAVEADTIVVRSGLYEYAFSTRGAAMVGARLLDFESYAAGTAEGAPVELVPEGERFFEYAVAVGDDTVQVAGRPFTASATALELSASNPRDSLTLSYTFPGEATARFEVTYTFRHDSYLVDVAGRVVGLEDRGYLLLMELAPGLRSNEKNAGEDYGQFAMVTNGVESDVQEIAFNDVEADTVRRAGGGPFHWVAIKSKYFLVAAVADTGGAEFGGASISGTSAEHEAVVSTSLPVRAGSGGFGFGVYLGPQDYGRLELIGQNLQDVNSYGYDWLQPIFRPLVAIIMPILVWLHTRLDLAYGWVLILFGVLMRVVLFPLYQKSMRAQIGQMRLQPIVQEIREKHKDDPQKMQQEMMRVYKEEGVNPLAGCLPMLVPMPILFTLYFVFQGTIEFRGVPFLWLPDLSLKDPLYIIPVVMGLSMFLLQWIGQRSTAVSNTQMKVMMYAMPIVFTVMFANFPSGLNLYYTTSNLASLPQQLFIARERKAAGVGQPSGTPSAEKG